jgi:hypothetical protein
MNSFFIARNGTIATHQSQSSVFNELRISNCQFGLDPEIKAWRFGDQKASAISVDRNGRTVNRFSEFARQK